MFSKLRVERPFVFLCGKDGSLSFAIYRRHSLEKVSKLWISLCDYNCTAIIIAGQIKFSQFHLNPNRLFEFWLT